MHPSNSDRGRRISGLLLLAVCLFATPSVASADTLNLSRSIFQGFRQFCFRNNNGTTGIQVTFGAGQCPRSATTPPIVGLANSNGPGAPTVGTYSFTLINANMPAMTLVRVGNTSAFTVVGNQPQFSFIYENGTTVHLTGTVRLTQILQTTNPDNALVAFGEFLRTGGTSPQFFGTGGTLFSQFVFDGGQTLINLWDQVVPQDPNNPDIGWLGQNAEFAVEGDITPFLTPSAAHVRIQGRVVTPGGTGIGKVNVSLAAPDGGRRSALTNPFGYYTFDDVEVGETYIVSVSSKRHTFANPSVTVSVVDEIAGLNFISEGP